MSLTFAQAYLKTFNRLMESPTVTFSCRGMQMWKEIVGYSTDVAMIGSSVSVFSHRQHRVTPIRFALAELCYILAGRDDVESIASYNKAMAHYADDGKQMVGSYGLRLRNQLLPMIERLKCDIHTRQACAAIFNEDDGATTTRTHIPCNVFLQCLCRPPNVYLHVISRSSDFATGFSIDTLHWQALLIMIANELTAFTGQTIYPAYVFYTISSLHMYAADIPVIEQWTIQQEDVRPYTSHEPYGYTIKLHIGLSDGIQRAKDMFKEGLSIAQLGEILMLNEESMYNVKLLHDKFLTHRNKLVR